VPAAGRGGMGRFTANAAALQEYGEGNAPARRSAMPVNSLHHVRNAQRLPASHLASQSASDLQKTSRAALACSRWRSMSGMPRSRPVTRASTASMCPTSKGVIKPREPMEKGTCIQGKCHR